MLGVDTCNIQLFARNTKLYFGLLIKIIYSSIRTIREMNQLEAKVKAFQRLNINLLDILSF